MRSRWCVWSTHIVPKHSRDLSVTEDKIISMYGKGMSNKSISNYIEEIYGITLSAQTASRMANKIISIIE